MNTHHLEELSAPKIAKECPFAGVVGRGGLDYDKNVLQFDKNALSTKKKEENILPVS